MRWCQYLVQRCELQHLHRASPETIAYPACLSSVVDDFTIVVPRVDAFCAPIIEIAGRCDGDKSPKAHKKGGASVRSRSWAG